MSFIPRCRVLMLLMLCAFLLQPPRLAKGQRQSDSRSQPISLTLKTLEQFVRWADDSDAAAYWLVREEILKARGDSAVLAPLFAQFENNRTQDLGLSLVILCIIGELKNPHALERLAQIIHAPLPRDEEAGHGLLSRRDGAAMLQAQAAENLAYLQTPAADSLTLSVIKSHPAAAVRSAAIDAYLYNHGDSAAAKERLRPLLSQQELSFLDRVRYTSESDVESFEKGLERFYKLHAETLAPIHRQTRPTGLFQQAGFGLGLPFFSFAMSPSIALQVQAASPCGKDGASKSELDLWKMRDCSSKMLHWFRQAYGIRKVNWLVWGYQDSCNINLPFAKTFNSAALLRFGLREDSLMQRRQWHGTQDYRAAGEATASKTHVAINYLPTVSGSWAAFAETAYFYGRTELNCNLFDYGNPNNNPATRAGAFIHEGWHHWQAAHGQATGHLSAAGNCKMPSKSCDVYATHYLRDYAFGEMHEIKLSRDDREIIHSPNQVQVEYLCDLAEFAASRIPASVKKMAQKEANIRLAERFINPVPYRCGKPRPW
jgi:hypothetical protein